MNKIIQLGILLVAAALLGGCVEPSTGLGANQAKVVASVSQVSATRGKVVASNPRIRFEGGDGSSLKQAIVIKGAAGEIDGVQSEYDWIAKMMPGWKPVSQALLQDGNKAFDALTVRKGAVSKVVYFDITDFFGRF